MDNEIEPIKTGIYRHYKGHLYKVLGVARHSETLEPLVAYANLETGELWVRPLSMFFEIIIAGDVPQPRFRYLAEREEECCG